MKALTWPCRTFLYENISSIEDLNAHKDELDNKIVGIEPGSSLMNLTNKAMKEYDIKLKLVQSSEAALMSELKSIYEKETNRCYALESTLGFFRI